MAFSDTTVFAPVPGPEPLSRRWGDEVAVFNPLSADTHLLSLATAEVLQTLCERPMALGELRRVVAEQDGGRSDRAEIERFLLELLEQLCAIELIQVREPADD